MDKGGETQKFLTKEKISTLQSEYKKDGIEVAKANNSSIPLGYAGRSAKTYTGGSDGESELVDRYTSSTDRRVGKLKEIMDIWGPMNIKQEITEKEEFMDGESSLQGMGDEMPDMSDISGVWETHNREFVNWKPSKDTNFKGMKGKARDRAASRLAVSLNKANERLARRLMPPPRMFPQQAEYITAAMVPWHTPQSTPN